MARRHSLSRAALALLCLSAQIHHTQALLPRDLLPRQYDKTEIQIDQAKHDEQFFNFVTRPDIDAPRWEVTVYDADAVAPGYWFMTAYGIVEQIDNDKAYVGPYIYDSNGDLIWSGAPLLDNYAAFDFKATEMDGEPVLTFIHPNDGAVYIFDSSYETKKAIIVGTFDEYGVVNKKSVNIHDFQIFDDSWMSLTRSRKDLSKSAMMNATGYEEGCRIEYEGFQEVSLATNEVLFSWDSETSIAINDSHVPVKDCDDAFDYFHANSVDKFSNGDYLLSGRHTYSIYKISHIDGSVIWRLDGVGDEKSDFEWIGDGHFLGQHDARLLQHNETHTLISVMDNAIGPGQPRSNNEWSRGLILGLRTDVFPKTAEVLAIFDHPLGGYAPGRGNVQILPNDNAFIGWSSQSLHSEHTPDGTIVMQALMPSGLKTYRSFKSPWIGLPNNPPDVVSNAVERHGAVLTTVHVSWNGATEVANWNLYHTNMDGGDMEVLASRKKDGFETALTHPGYAAYVVVEAVDNHGNRLGISNVIKTIAPSNALAPDVIAENQWQTEHSHATFITTSGAWDVFKNPAVAFFSGVLCCLAAVLSIWTVWYVRRKGSQSWQLSMPYSRLSYTSDVGDEEASIDNKQDDEKDSASEYQDESSVDNR